MVPEPDLEPSPDMISQIIRIHFFIHLHPLLYIRIYFYDQYS
jgi:hypothetical protein